MGMMQRRRRYRLEIDQPDKRGKVYADGQAATSAHFRRAFAVATFMGKVHGLLSQARAIREMALPRPMSVEHQRITLTSLPIDDARVENLMASLTRAAKAAGSNVVVVDPKHTAS